MAKRRAEDAPLRDSPSKRCSRSLRIVDLRPGGVAPTTAGGLRPPPPPPLLALLGSRCRKRPRCSEDPDQRGDAAEPAAGVAAPQTSGSLRDRRSRSAAASAEKRAREGRASPEAAVHGARETAGEDRNAEDGAYNSFQYWRVPLPELDLSLLEDDQSQTKDKPKVKDPSSSSSSSSVAMET